MIRISRQDYTFVFLCILLAFNASECRQPSSRPGLWGVPPTAAPSSSPSVEPTSAPPKKKKRIKKRRPETSRKEALTTDITTTTRLSTVTNPELTTTTGQARDDTRKLPKIVPNDILSTNSRTQANKKSLYSSAHGDDLIVVPTQKKKKTKKVRKDSEKERKTGGAVDAVLSLGEPKPAEPEGATKDNGATSKLTRKKRKIRKKKKVYVRESSTEKVSSASSADAKEEMSTIKRGDEESTESTETISENSQMGQESLYRSTSNLDDTAESLLDEPQARLESSSDAQSALRETRDPLETTEIAGNGTNLESSQLAENDVVISSVNGTQHFKNVSSVLESDEGSTGSIDASHVSTVTLATDSGNETFLRRDRLDSQLQKNGSIMAPQSNTEVALGLSNTTKDKALFGHARSENKVESNSDSSQDGVSSPDSQTQIEKSQFNTANATNSSVAAFSMTDNGAEEDIPTEISAKIESSDKNECNSTLLDEIDEETSMTGHSKEATPIGQEESKDANDWESQNISNEETDSLSMLASEKSDYSSSDDEADENMAKDSPSVSMSSGSLFSAANASLTKDENSPGDTKSSGSMNASKTLFEGSASEKKNVENASLPRTVSVEELAQATDTDDDLYVSIVTWNLAEESPEEADSQFIRQFRKHGVDGKGSDFVLISGQECENIKPRRTEGRRSREFRRLAVKHLGKRYVPIAIHQLGGIQFCLFCRRAILGDVQSVSVADVTCGVGNVFHNKGAIAAFVQVRSRKKNDAASAHAKSLKMLFVTAHLAAHVKNFEARDSDFWRIMTELEAQAPPSFDKSLSNESSGGPRLFDTCDRVFICGDLNYRMDLPREFAEHCVVQMKEYLDRGDTQSLLLAKKLRKDLLRYDQLRSTMAARRAFVGLAEGEIKFVPTFKYDKHSDEFDTSPKQRIPAWTDRILFKPVGTRVIEYDSVPEAKHSDHRPVLATFRVNAQGRPQKSTAKRKKRTSSKSVGK